jgi:hypothetical protein
MCKTFQNDLEAVWKIFFLRWKRNKKVARRGTSGETRAELRALKMREESSAAPVKRGNQPANSSRRFTSSLLSYCRFAANKFSNGFLVRRVFGALLLILFLLVSQTPAQFICLPNGSPVTVNGSLTPSDPQQTGRIVRDGDPSSCMGKTNTLQNSTLVRYDSQTFANPTGQNACVTVDVNFNGCNFNTTGIAAYSTFNPANPAANVVGDLGFSTFETGSFSFSVATGASFTIVVHEIDAGTGCPNYSYKISYSTSCRQAGFDLENDGKANLAVFRPSNGNWNVTSFDSTSVFNTQFGLNGDRPTAADYSGDGITDIGVFRPVNGVWYSLLSPNNTFYAAQFGISEDIPVRGDYDRDGKIDIAVWRPSSRVWYILRSSDNTVQIFQWGAIGDIPAPGDYDGDRINDYAVFRPNNAGKGYGAWWVLLSNFNYGYYTVAPWGSQNDKPVPADYDGDTITDFAVYRPSNGFWYIFKSSQTGATPYIYFQWGTSEDIPQPADYDGDRKADFCVFRPSNNTWYLFGSADGFRQKTFGVVGDVPATSSFTSSN